MGSLLPFLFTVLLCQQVLVCLSIGGSWFLAVKESSHSCAVTMVMIAIKVANKVGVAWHNGLLTIIA